MTKHNPELIIEKIKDITETNLNAWKNARGYAPDDVADKIDLIMIDWIISLTNCLNTWNKNIENLTVGELILARANLGTLVENWLKFFIVIYLESYNSNPVRNSKGKKIKPEKIRFDVLRKYYKNNILVKSGGKFNDWIQSIQTKRNAIHAFNYKEIGTNQELQNDFNSYLDFIEYLINRMPENPKEFVR